MTETMYAILDSQGVVINVIVADKNFVDSIPNSVASDDIDTGNLSVDNRYINITKLDVLPSIDWTYSNNKFTPPPPPPPVEEPVVNETPAS